MLDVGQGLCKDVCGEVPDCVLLSSARSVWGTPPNGRHFGDFSSILCPLKHSANCLLVVVEKFDEQ